MQRPTRKVLPIVATIVRCDWLDDCRRPGDLALSDMGEALVMQIRSLGYMALIAAAH
jgi:hypothetical protein